MVKKDEKLTPRGVKQLADLILGSSRDNDNEFCCCFPTVQN